MSRIHIPLLVVRTIDNLLAGSVERYINVVRNDPSIDNHARYTYCNDHHASIMVSIHHNFFGDDTVDYGMDLFYKAIDIGLATSIVNATSARLDVTNNGMA